ncbi:MAG: hypothetical protein Q9209_006531 [Squamulea sp. 1 TL-2023]
MSCDESKQEDRDPWADPNSPESNVLCVPNDIPFPTNIKTILEESRKASDNPNIISWKEIACAGPGDTPSKPKDDIASRFEESTLEDKQSGVQRGVGEVSTDLQKARKEYSRYSQLLSQWHLKLCHSYQRYKQEIEVTENVESTRYEKE